MISEAASKTAFLAWMEELIEWVERRRAAAQECNHEFGSTGRVMRGGIDNAADDGHGRGSAGSRAGQPEELLPD